MRFSSFATALLVGAAQAIDVQVVYVGKNPVNNATASKFWPDSIKAKAGSMIQFQFWAGNHTATQSSFDAPCTPMEATNTGDGNSTAAGIKSGFQPVDASAAKGEIPTWTVWVNDTKPLWFYCAQSTHCQGGMSMVVNEDTTSDKTLTAYQKASAALDGGADSGNSSSGGSGSGSGSGSSGDADAVDGGSGGSGAAGMVVPSTMLLLVGTAMALF